jgi:hypothetical protein
MPGSYGSFFPPMAYAIATTVKPKAIAVPDNPIPLGPAADIPAITAEPHPKRTRLNVPMNSAPYFFIGLSFQSFLFKYTTEYFVIW